MRHFPLDYLKIPFRADLFPDLYWPIGIASLVLLVGAVVLYNVRVRQLHRHEPLRTLQEWLLWTAVVTFSLTFVGWVFNFYFLFEVLFIVIGVATLVWVRFFRFPPEIAAYNEQLRRQRFFSQARYKHAEATLRPRRGRGQRRRRG